MEGQPVYWLAPLALMVGVVIVGGAVGLMQKRNQRRVEHDAVQAESDDSDG